MSAAAERLRGTGHPQQQVMASAEYLAQHLAEVPAIVIPTIIGRHDGNGRPGLFDSVIQAAWSFCLALRARGLGTTWVTAALQDEARVKEILGIPAHMTEIVLFPVAWPKGTDFRFRRAGRHPARAITYFDRIGFTSEQGPGESLRFEHGPGAIVEIDIDAAPAVVWPLVSDPKVPTAFSDESIGAEWHSDDAGLGRCSSGATITRLSGSGPCRASSTPATKRAPSAGARPIKRTPEHGGVSTWNRRPVAPSCGSSYIIGLGPSATSAPIASHPGKEARVLRRRLNEVPANMQRTVEGIKRLAEESR